MREGSNNTFEDNNDGHGVPDHGGMRDGGYIFPNPDGKYKEHEDYNEERGDITVQEAFDRELANAREEAQQQCEDCCKTVTIKVSSLDDSGKAWMKRKGFDDGSTVETITCD
jgi:hypothetical protein